MYIKEVYTKITSRSANKNFISIQSILLKKKKKEEERKKAMTKLGYFLFSLYNVTLML